MNEEEEEGSCIPSLEENTVVTVLQTHSVIFCVPSGAATAGKPAT